MNRKQKLGYMVLGIMLAGGLFGCATVPIQLVPVVDNQNMDTIYVQGRGVARSFGEKSWVSISGTIKGDELGLVVACRSRTERIDVIPESIEVVATDVYGRLFLLNVYSPIEYITKKRNAQEWSLVLQAFAGALAAREAGGSTTTISGWYGDIWFDAKVKTKDGAARANELARQGEGLRQNAEHYARVNAAMMSGLLKAHTVFRDQSVGGVVIVKLPYGFSSGSDAFHKITVTVPWVGEEPHRITLSHPTNKFLGSNKLAKRKQSAESQAQKNMALALLLMPICVFLIIALSAN